MVEKKNLSYGISGSFAWVCFLKHNSKNIAATGKDLQTTLVLFWYQPQKMHPVKWKALSLCGYSYTILSKSENRQSLIQNSDSIFLKQGVHVMCISSKSDLKDQNTWILEYHQILPRLLFNHCKSG